MFLQLEEASKKKEPADNRTARESNLILRHACNLKSLKTLQQVRKYTETTEAVKILIASV